MLAQRLRHQIRIRQRATSLNGYRENTGAWSTFATVYAGIEQLTGREFVAMQAMQADVTCRVVVRHEDVDGVTTQMVVVFDNRVFDIVEVRNLRERDRVVYLMCRVSTDPDSAGAIADEAGGSIADEGGGVVGDEG